MIRPEIKLHGNILSLEYKLSNEDIKTLAIIAENEGEMDFDNRTEPAHNDHGVSWRVCDRLVEIGLLDEDEESFDIYFELSETGKQVIQLMKTTA